MIKDMDTNNLTLPVQPLIYNLVPNDTLIKVFWDLDEAVRFHEEGKIRQDADILALKMWRVVFEEALASEGYDFEAREFLG